VATQDHGATAAVVYMGMGMNHGNSLAFLYSASARISKGQGYQGFLRKRAGGSFGQKWQFASYKEKRTEFHSFRVNKMFSLKF
jgi:hypothetical protein